MYTKGFAEVCAVLGKLSATDANAAVGEHTLNYVDLADYHRVFIWLSMGDPGPGASIDVTLTELSEGFLWEGGNVWTVGVTHVMTDGDRIKGARLLATKMPAQIVAGDAGDHLGIEISASELEVNYGYHAVRITVRVNVSAYRYSLVVFGSVGRYVPVGATGYLQLMQ